MTLSILEGHSSIESFSIVVNFVFVARCTLPLHLTSLFSLTLQLYTVTH